ncbi:erythrocyte membrane protein 1, PfEMP1, putative [Plasmodium reichenowi]|uniref:Erythrocyte membrane protein 1, PfEMP1, putative n=1 Tax=Plasmodium reichenowi TaxID=5854 RepID=A0A2P9D5Q5_PLARE|nr:erythrocyte membrane protein 1, PfEMP1, putative [Plasmodium reichenowi]
MAPAAATASKYSDAKDVKELLDRIGEDVYKKVKGEAEQYREKLKGSLQEAKNINVETLSTIRTCDLVDAYRNGAVEREDPCGNGKVTGEVVNRFSDTRGGQCTRAQISGSTYTSGACAPLRRLHLCDQNIEHIKSTDITNDTLLAEVCLAAKYEGQSIKDDHAQYQSKNEDFKTHICTELARSFADIGDIVRGRDLFRGNPQEKDLRKKLEENLQRIFKEIHGGLGNEAQNYYKDDDGDFFKLREDWWDANRATIWEAITCNAGDGTYFRASCDSGDEKGQTMAKNQCRCTKPSFIGGTKREKAIVVNVVPTYFDYVPQFLRWFEEWAEDFCRKRKHKLQNAIKKCRQVESGNQTYCSGNGYDCVETIRGEEHFVEGECHDCSVACTPFVKWLDNQKLEFDKQKKKYAAEIKIYTEGTARSTDGRRKRSAITKVYDGYEKNFYEKLEKTDYKDVKKFLELLGKEGLCEKQPKVEGEDGKASSIDFKNENYTTTFSRTTICEPCPWCGTEQKEKGKWEAKEETKCREAREEGNYTNTEIQILMGDKSQLDILKKYKTFCTKPEKSEKGGANGSETGKDGNQMETWKCYYKEKKTENGSDAINFCILQNDKKNTKEEKSMPYNSFFWKWVHDMLHDSLDWRTQLGSCTNDKTNGQACNKRNKCKDKCECFKKWSSKKKKEWKAIKDHFLKQEDMKEETECNPFVTLEFLLKEGSLMQNIKDVHANADDIERIRGMLEETGVEVDGAYSGGSGSDKCGNRAEGEEDNTIIDKFLQEEIKEADVCQLKQKKCEEPRDPNPGRSLNDPQPSPVDTTGSDEEDFEEDFSEEEENENEEKDEGEEEESVSTKKEDTTQIYVCETVEKALTDQSNLTAACDLKYNKGKNYGWRCVPTGNTNSDVATTRERGVDGDRSGGRSKREAPRDKPTVDNGGICIPPRRRRLYIGGLTKWATSDEATSNGPTEAQGEAKPAPTETQTTDTQIQSGSENPLLKAFVESAAIETFFLWHNYTTQWKLENKKPEDDLLGAGGPPEIKAVSELAGGAGPSRGPLAPYGFPGHFMSSDGPSSWTGKQEQSSPVFNGLNSEGSLQSHVLPPPSLNGQLQQKPVPLHSDSGTLYHASGDSSDSSENPSSPDKQLLRGDIPAPFLRQMFYTLGDYRDILVGNVPHGIDEVNGASGSGKDKDIKSETSSKETDMQKIKKAIEKHFQNSGDQSSRVISGPSSGPSSPSEKNSGQSRETLWDEIAPSIWNGMICALTYKDDDSGAMGQLPKQNSDLKKAFFGDKNPSNKPDKHPEGNKGTFYKTYHYNNVVLEDKDSDGPMITGGSHSSPSNGSTTLAEFVTRPAYFRWLEEWGENFCKKRTEMLEQVEKGCMEEDGKKPKKQKCSCDGEDCETIRNGDPTIAQDFNCQNCSKPCGWYKKWINIKKTEYENQQKAYNNQKQDAITNSGNTSGNKYDSNFVGKLSSDYASIESFLEKLGPCKNDSGEDNGEDKLNFKDPEQTFKHATNCKPCSEFKIKCQDSKCNGFTENKCNGKTTITAKDIEEKTDPNGDIEILVSDNNKSGNGFASDLKDDCEKADIFKGIRKDVWKCSYVCGLDLCDLNSLNGVKHDEKNVLISALIRRWLEYFLYDYKKIRKKLKPCMNSGEGSKCENKCQQKCNCVEKWVNEKRKEWKEIKDRYIKRYNGGTTDDKSLVRNFLEELLSQIAAANDKEKIKELSDLENSLKCNCPGTLKKGQDCKESDIIDCMLDKLEDKANKCQKNHTQTGGENPENKCKEVPPLPDEEEETEVENTVGKQHPSFCKIEEEKKEEEEDGEKCEPAADENVAETVAENEEDSGTPGPAPEQTAEEPSEGDQPKQDANNPDQRDEAPKSESKDKTPAAPSTPTTQREEQLDQPLSDQTTNSISDILSSTLPFGIAIALTSFALFFIKKKTKSSVDMLRVMQIPQNYYGIPTEHSSNRYIPYTSGKYRGKRYIYLEGDSGTDSGYTDHYSDITSSSESEYEELDINDIYVPHAPKYKTLIEVVLEPSKRDTTNTPNDITSDDTPSNKFTEEEWNQLKNDFISNMLQSEQNDVPNDYTSGNSPLNTIPNILRDMLDQKPFIMSIHDRNLLSGEEYNYDMSTNSGNNDLYSGENNLYSGFDPTIDKHGSYSDYHHPYSAIDLINDSLNSGNQPIDIYDEILKRKENELFGTNHVKQTSTHSVSKPSRDDPIHNQLNLFHKWLDRQRHMCEQWDKNKKEELLDKLKVEWKNETHSGNINNGIASGNHVLNTDVSIQINMNDPNPINQFTNMDTNPDNFIKDTILNNLEKYNEPYYYDFYEDDIYYNVNDDKTSVDHINMDYNKMDNNNLDVPTKVQIEMNIVNNKREIFEEEYPMSDIWNI